MTTSERIILEEVCKNCSDTIDNLGTIMKRQEHRRRRTGNRIDRLQEYLTGDDGVLYYLGSIMDFHCESKRKINSLSFRTKAIITFLLFGGIGWNFLMICLLFKR